MRLNYLMAGFLPVELRTWFEMEEHGFWRRRAEGVVDDDEENECKSLSNTKMW